MSAPAPLCKRLDWDSRFFGLAIARAVPDQVDAAGCQAMLQWSADERIDCLYFLAHAEADASNRLLEAHGFERVDERVTLERAIPTSPPAAAGARGAQPGDIPALREIAAISHRDSRFYTDGRFDRGRCDEFYRVWIENSCQGWADHVVVAEHDGAAVGYLTVHVKSPELATLGLMGVEPGLRRHGIGSRLLDGALAWIAARGIPRVALATQGRNANSNGFFGHAGFVPVARSYWYHRWFDKRPAAAR